MNPKELAEYFTNMDNYNLNIGSLLLLINQCFGFSKLFSKIKTVMPPNAMNVFDNEVISKIESGESH